MAGWAEFPEQGVWNAYDVSPIYLKKKHIVNRQVKIS
jgi:hypothetical protein